MNTYQTHFKVCSLNLFNYVSPPNAFYETDNIYTLPKWQKKQDWISRQLAALAPDIVGFQEVFSPNELEALVAKHDLPHFITVSEPGVDAHHVYNKPVVALASRFPILSASAVEVTPEVVSDLKLQPDFHFSRSPIRAEIQVDDFTRVLVYVVHLKSKRSGLEHQSDELEDSKTAVANHLLAQVHGSWASTIQRGTEAALLYYDMVQQMQLRERPVIVLGDFNDSLDSAPLQALIGGQKADRLNGKIVKDLPLNDRRAIQRFSLYDAFELQNEFDPDKRIPTHYFANKGNVLDYILLSKDFNGQYDHGLAHVSDYQVSDKHLVKNHHEDDIECSDHAAVMVEIEIRV